MYLTYPIGFSTEHHKKVSKQIMRETIAKKIFENLAKLIALVM
jgi:hypothetical protein